MTSSIPSRVRLIDVGPRDGLQNEKTPVPAAVKVELVHRLQQAGLKEIEVTSYVSPKWVPQMGDNHEVMSGIVRQPGVAYSVLTPNLKGFEAAVLDQPDEIVVFGSASEAFSQRNINCSIAESIERFAPVVQAALAAGIRVRGAMSCTVGCPYEGDIAPERVAYLAGLLKGIGVQRVDVARRYRTRSLHWNWACGISSRPWPGWAAALTPRVRLATWRPKTWSTCCTAWTLIPALTWTG